jgi:hypothetical protein
MPTQDLPSAIRLMTVPDYWPPLGADQAGGTPPGGAQVPPQPGSPQSGQPELEPEPEPEPGQPKPGPPRPSPVSADQAETPAQQASPPWPRQFAVLLAEGLAGVRPVRQVLPWMSEQGSAHLHRLLPLFADGHRPRLRRVITAQPAKDVIEMTMIVAFGPRTRALAVRLEQTEHRQSPRWRCTAIEAA